VANANKAFATAKIGAEYALAVATAQADYGLATTADQTAYASAMSAANAAYATTMDAATATRDTATQAAKDKRADDSAAADKALADDEALAEKTYQLAEAAARSTEIHAEALARKTHDTNIAALDSAYATLRDQSWSTSLATATSTRTDPWSVQARQQAAAKSTRTASVSTATSTHDAALASYLADWTNANIDAKTLAINARATAIATSSGAKNLASYNFGTSAPVSIGGITGSGTIAGGGDSPFAFVGYGEPEKQPSNGQQPSSGNTPGRASSPEDVLKEYYARSQQNLLGGANPRSPQSLVKIKTSEISSWNPFGDSYSFDIYKSLAGDFLIHAYEKGEFVGTTTIRAASEPGVPELEEKLLSDQMFLKSVSSGAKVVLEDGRQAAQVTFIVAGIFVPGPDDLFFAYLASKHGISVLRVAGKLVFKNEAGEEIAEDAIAELAKEYRALGKLEEVAPSRLHGPADLERISRIRSDLGVGKGRNIAFGEGHINGKDFGEVLGVSGRNTPGVQMPSQRIFQTGVDRYDRAFDGDVFVLENIARRLKPTDSGTLRLVSELPFCESCLEVVAQFRKMFPNIRLILVDGTP
jgi:hypothetical protein